MRHRPERTLLFQLVEDYYPTFKAYLAARGMDLPGYLEQEFEEYLKCGRRFRWVKAPTSAELSHLTQALALRIGRCLER